MNREDATKSQEEAHQEELSEFSAIKVFALCYGMCFGSSAIIKLIEENGGIVKGEAVKSADYVIVTARPIDEKNSFVYAKEQQIYDRSCFRTDYS